LGPQESSMQTASRSLQPFLQGSLSDRSTDRPTDHATRSITIGGAHSLQPFLQGSLSDRSTDRPTDHATRSITIGGAHSRKSQILLLSTPVKNRKRQRSLFLLFHWPIITSASWQPYAVVGSIIKL